MIERNFTNEKDIRIDNLKQFITDVYKNKSTKFYKDFRHNLVEKMKYSEDQAEAKSKQLRQAMGKYKNKTFSATLQTVVEKAFSLPKNILSKTRPQRLPAYIFLACPGNSARILFKELQKREIVDEISVLFGDVDVFVRAYGTIEEIQKLVTIDLYEIEDVEIRGTRTYFSIGNENWSRHPIGKHPFYKPPADRWLK